LTLTVVALSVLRLSGIILFPGNARA
jgi:hypothetical protein